MKKTFFTIIFLSLPFLLPTPSQAVEIGTNIVTNFSEKNLQTIYDARGSSFPLTIRLGPEFLDDPSQTTTLVQTLQSIGFSLSDITWQPEDWEGYPAENFPLWKEVFAALPGGTLSLFTEYNSLGSNQDPAQFADILREALLWQSQGIIKIPLASTNFNISHPNFPSFVKSVEANCPGCLAKLDKISLSVYVGAFTQQKYQGETWAINDFVRQVNYALNNLKLATGTDFSGKPILITELGLWPNAQSYPLSERLNDVLSFASDLEKAFAAGKIPFNIESLTFLVMDDATGQQCFVYKDLDQDQWVTDCDIDLGSGPTGRASDKCILCGCQKASSVAFKPVTICFQSPEEVISGLFRVKNSKTADTSPQYESQLKMIPYLQRSSQTKKIQNLLQSSDSSSGQIKLEVCDIRSGKFFKVPPMPALIPAFYQGLFDTSGTILSLTSPERARYLYPHRGQQAEANEGVTVPELVGPNGIPLVQRSPGRNGTELYFTQGSCQASGSSATCSVTVQGTPQSGHDWVHLYTSRGEKYMLGINAIFDGPLVYNITFPIDTGKPQTLTFETINHDQADSNGSKPTDVQTCTLTFNAQGTASCTLNTDSPPLPTSAPKKCEPYGTHESLNQPYPIPPSRTGLSFRSGLSLEDFLKQIGEALGVCETYRFLVTPELCLPYTQPVFDATEAPMVGSLTRPQDLTCESGEVIDIDLVLKVGEGENSEQEIPIEFTTNCRKSSTDLNKNLKDSYTRFSQFFKNILSF